MASDLIDALARFGDGLPANVLPVRVNEVTQLGPENIAAVFAYGGSGVAMLTRAKPKHDIAGLRRAVEMSDTIVAALGFGAGLVRIIETDDPDQLRAMLDAAPAGVARQSRPASFRAAPSAACSKPLFANCTSPRPRRSMSCRLRRARRSAASI